MLKKVKMIYAAAVVFAIVSPCAALAENKLIVKNSAEIEKFVVTDTGRVGSGTSAPIAAFHAQGDTSDKIQFISQYLATSQNGGGGFLVYHNNASTINGGLPQKSDRLGYFLFGSRKSGVSLNGGGLIARAEDIWTTTSIPTYFAFETAPKGTTTRSERMRITSAGNVGINSTAPTQLLEVKNGGIRINNTLAKPACDANARGTFWFSQGGVSQADNVEVCIKNADGTFGWKPLWQ